MNGFKDDNKPRQPAPTSIPGAPRGDEYPAPTVPVPMPGVDPVVTRPPPPPSTPPTGSP
jgi:hypothetical protein